MAPESNSKLTDYPRPSLTVDGIVLSVYRGVLSVVLIDSPDRGWGLPGTFVHEGETLTRAVDRALNEKLSMAPLRGMRQLHVFDSPQRDPRGWVFSVAHYALVHERTLDSVRPMQVVPVEDALHMKLAFDHTEMLSMAVQRLREEYSERPDPFGVLEVFTLRDLRDLHEAIDRSTYLRDTFRRVMEPQLIQVEGASGGKGQLGRPSRLWRTMTAEERLLRKYADRDRVQSRRKQSSRDAGSAERSARLGDLEMTTLFSLVNHPPDELDAHVDLGSSSQLAPPKDKTELFSVEFSFSESGVVRHEGLREREAYKLFDEFVRDVASTADDELVVNRPTRARILDEFGHTLKDQTF